jgi:hypothetical protein
MTMASLDVCRMVAVILLGAAVRAGSRIALAQVAFLTRALVAGPCTQPHRAAGAPDSQAHTRIGPVQAE